MAGNKKKLNRAIGIMLAAFAMLFLLHPHALAAGQWAPSVQTTSEQSITLGWPLMDGAWAYAIYRSDSEDGEYKRVETLYGRTIQVFEDKDCVEGEKYYYRVSYFTFSGLTFQESEPSEPISATATKRAKASSLQPITFSPMSGGFDILPFEDERFESSPVITEGIIKSATALGTNSVEITWNAMPDAVNYHVCRSITPLGNYEVVGSTTETTYLDETCSPETTYYYSLGIEKQDGMLSQEVAMPKGVQTEALSTSTPATVPPATSGAVPATTKPATTATPTQKPTPTTTKPNPAPTTKPVAAAPRPATKPAAKALNETSVEISWTKSKDAGSYNIYRSIDQGSSFELAGEVDKNQTRFTDSKLTGNAVYYYYVTAVKGGLESAPTVVVSVTLGRVEEIVLTPYTQGNNSGVKLEWGKVSGAKKYSVYRSENGSDYELLKIVSSRSYDDANPPMNKTLWYKVVSDNGATAMANTKTGNHVLAVKAKKTGDNSTFGISLVWDAVSGADYYEVSRSLDGGNFELLGTTENRTWLDIPLQQDTMYCYKVVSSNGVEGHVDQRTSKASLPLLALPNGTGQNRSITLRWGAIEGATSYTIYRSGPLGNYQQVDVTTGTSWTDTDVSPLKNYYYRVDANNGISGKFASIALW